MSIVASVDHRRIVSVLQVKVRLVFLKQLEDDNQLNPKLQLLSINRKEICH